jgi:ubiquinone/menaquinone biosynthesis C-methylase UbiE
MKAFYEMDLTRLEFDAIPDNYFDFIMMAHIIEHLTNGDLVIEKLLTKLKPGGMIYIEYPAFRSTKFPKMDGTLNFFDDPTHVRIYSVMEMYNLLMRHNMEIIKGGTSRHWPNILWMIPKIPFTRMKYGKVLPSIFWDFMGFAEFVFAKKK